MLANRLISETDYVSGPGASFCDFFGEASVSPVRVALSSWDTELFESDSDEVSITMGVAFRPGLVPDFAFDGVT